MKKIRKRISRAKFENIAYLALNVFNMITFSMVFAASITKANQSRLSEIIQAIYCTTISFLLILNEFLSLPWMHFYFGFLSIHRGKGILMLFLGCLVICDLAFNIIVTILAFTTGFTHLLLSLVPTIPPPNCFLVHWQNHNDFWAEGLDLAIPPTVPTITTTTFESNANMLHNTVPLLQFPHPSAWHPPSSKIASNSAHSFLTSTFNIDCTQYNGNNHHLRVSY
ncbi:COPI associated protein-domain-containing protein, partial [Gilbertella persicaria]|uniref:COPI associated protein-domain-containing protein n=1 Tax=Gilbertella persicaria TaxID=101096 RepID=UPI00221ED9BC